MKDERVDTVFDRPYVEPKFPYFNGDEFYNWMISENFRLFLESPEPGTKEFYLRA